MSMRTKTFDCVEMKRRAAAIILREIADMTPEQELAYWQERTEALREKKQQLQRDRKGC